MTLDGIMFDHVRSLLFEVTIRYARDKASICPHISYAVVMNVIVKRDVFQLLGRVQTKNGIVLFDS